MFAPPFPLSLPSFFSASCDLQAHEYLRTSYRYRTGASRVLVYNHTVRSKPSNEFGDQVKGRYQGTDGPAYCVHVDKTPEGARNTVRFIFPDLAHEVDVGNFQLLNVWRPLKRVTCDPLMVADMAVMPVNDLIMVPRSYYNGL